MIDQKAREELLRLVKPGDYAEASAIYEQKQGRPIYFRYLEKFLKGDRKVKGENPGSHQPLDMYAAIVDAIKAREQRAAEMTKAARELKAQLEPC